MQTNSERAFYSVKATKKDGREYQVNVYVDLNKIAREYGQRAHENKRKQTRFMYGAVKVEAQDLPVVE